MSDKITVGVFGLGSIGLRHASNLITLGYDVIGFDPSHDRQNMLVEKGGICAGKEEILNQAKAVIIATPNQYHLEDMRTCLELGVHAFVEKPLSHTMNGLPELEHLATEKGLIVGLAMNIRYNPAIRHLRDQLNTGTIGQPLWGNYTLHSFLPDWRPQQDHRRGYAADPKTGGVIFDAVHGIDIAQYLLGDYDVVGAVAQQSGIIDIPSDDMADILCRHINGLTSHLHMDYITKPKKHCFTVATNKGFAKVDISHRHYCFTDKDGTVTDDIRFTETNVNDDYTEELNQFMKAVIGEKGHYCPLSEGIKVTKNTLKARELAGLPHE